MAERQLTPSQLQALVKLLGDSNERVAKLARARLLEAGGEAIPWVAQAVAAEADPVVRARARVLLDEMRFGELQRRLHRLAARPEEGFDLEEGLFLVARARYLELDEEPYRRQLEEMVRELARRQLGRLSPTEAAAVANRFFFTEMGLRSNEAHYYDPDNVCINQVLHRRLGISISLAALYMLVARRAGFMVEAISLPGRFVIAVPAPSPFWLDPTRNGRVLSRHDLVAIAREAGHQFDPTMLEPVSPREIVTRMLAHLLRVYALTSQQVPAQRLEQLLRIINRRTTGDEGSPSASHPQPSSAEGRPD